MMMTIVNENPADEHFHFIFFDITFSCCNLLNFFFLFFWPLRQNEKQTTITIETKMNENKFDE